MLSIYGEMDPRTEEALRELRERVRVLRAENNQRRRTMPIGGKRTNEAAWTDCLGHLADDLDAALGIEPDEDQ